MCRTALSTSTRSTWSTRPSSPSAGAGSPCSATTSEPRRAASACISRAAVRCQLAELELVVRDREAAGVEAREVEQVGRELGQPLHLLAHRVEELAALGLGEPALGEQLEVAAERGQRRAQLVRGVRDERRACALERLEPYAHLLQRARQVADLVARAVHDRLGERAVRDAVGRGAQTRQAARERLRGQRAGQRARCAKASPPPITRRRSTAETCCWTSRSGASTSTTPSTPWLETKNVSTAVRPAVRFVDPRVVPAQAGGLLARCSRALPSSPARGVRACAAARSRRS